MPTLALFSDIHANLPALEAVLEDIARRDVDALYCLGDLVGYSTWPNEVAGMLRARRIPTLAGNYDEGVGLNSDDCGCAYQTDEDRARGVESIAYTNGVVTDRVRAYLRGLPRHFRLTYEATPRAGSAPFEVLFVHGSPRRINEYLFEDRPDASLLRMMETAGADVMAFGHTHKPFYRRLRYDADGAQRYRHAINLGSVGKPKDGDPRACYALVHLDPERGLADPEACRVEFIRVPYDVERAAQAIEASPLPDAFARMLREGG